MALFMDVHDGFVGVSQADVEGAHKADLAIEAAEGVHFRHWWADPGTGKVFCLAEGPNKDAVLRVHARAGHPAKEIYELALNGE